MKLDLNEEEVQLLVEALLFISLDQVFNNWSSNKCNKAYELALNLKKHLSDKIQLDLFTYEDFWDNTTKEKLNALSENIIIHNNL